MDEIRINAPKGTKFIFIFCLVISSVSLLIGITSDDSYCTFGAWTLFGTLFSCGIYFFYQLKTYFIIDKDGITRYFLKHSRHMQWSEMKYIGYGKERVDLDTAVTSGPRTVMLFMTVPYSEYDRYHTIAGTIRQNKYVFTIEYIDDATYQKILSFSGGERNIP